MPVFHNHRAIFLHIGKTAGFSIEKALGMGGKDYKVFDEEVVYGLNKGVMTQHAKLSYIEQFLTDKQKKEYFKFTIVRNPWDRMVSAYHYLHDFHVKKFGDFEKWLEHKHDMVTNNKYREGSHYTPQVEFTHCDGQQVVDYIGRFEDLEGSYKHICNSIGIEYVPLKKLNPSKSRKKSRYIEYYNQGTAKMVEDMYSGDIEVYDYKFE